jgi:tryptophan 2,3-dioxygenase
MKKTSGEMNYSDYLHLDKILSAQHPVSHQAHARSAHDEMLFIIIHQVYELWFKQIIHELDSVIAMFQTDIVDEKHVGVAVARLLRMSEIQKVLIQQIDVIETMTPLDFLDFRGYLPGASGFQSMQFRKVENKLGLRPEQRLTYGGCPYHASYTNEAQQEVLQTEQEPSLFHCIERWLERTPFLGHTSFDFRSAYLNNYLAIIQREKESMLADGSMSAHEQKLRTDMAEQSATYIRAALDPTSYEKLRAEGQHRFSHQAFLGALFINLYRDEPILYEPFRLLSALLNIEEYFSIWRHRHSLMVRRMIGSKIGTGGSSGFDYLKSTVEKHVIFTDLAHLSNFYMSRSSLPPLPQDVQEALGFRYVSRTTTDNSAS